MPLHRKHPNVSHVINVQTTTTPNKWHGVGLIKLSHREQANAVNSLLVVAQAHYHHHNSSPSLNTQLAWGPFKRRGTLIGGAEETCRMNTLTLRTSALYLCVPLRL